MGVSQQEPQGFGAAQLSKNLEDYKVDALPSSLYYIPDYITPSEESLLLDRVSVEKIHIRQTYRTHPNEEKGRTES